MGVVYFSIIPTFEPSRYCKCWIVCFNYRNSFMDLLILATAVENKERLITQDKELNKVLKKSYEYLSVSTCSKEISSIDYNDKHMEKDVKSDNKGHINNRWRIMIEKKKII